MEGAGSSTRRFALSPRGRRRRLVAAAVVFALLLVGTLVGVLPGIVGSLQASEVLKLTLGIGESLAGRLLLFDALHTTFDEVAIRRNPECPVCGDHPTITEYIDYVEFCQGPAVPAT